MPVPTVITDLSTTISSNSPAGSDIPSTLDDHLRAHAGFIAQLAAGSAFTGSVRLGGATQGIVGTRASGGSSQTANTSFDDAVIDSSANSGLSILSGASSTGGVLFGDSGNSSAGALRYAHTSDEMSLWAAGASRVTLTSAGAVSAVPVFVRAGTATGATASTSYDDLVIDSTANSGITLLGSNTALQGLLFGDTDNNASGRVLYSHASDTLSLWAGGATVLTANSGGVIFGGNVQAGYGPSSTTFETQATNKTTAVTVAPVNPAFGIQMANTSLAAGATAAFTVNHANVGAGVMVIGQISGSFSEFHSMRITNITTGSFVVRVTNIDSVARAEPVTLEFVLFAGPT